MAVAVIVWEYCRDGLWLNFERSFSDIIEENFSKGYKGQLIIEQQTTSSTFYVNLLEMTLIVVSTRDTSMFFIRRNVFNQDSVPGKGIFWQWLCDSSNCWKDYHLNVAIFLENLSRGDKSDRTVDLSHNFPNYNALVNLKSMTHQEKSTGLRTSIKRVIDKPYASKQVSTTSNPHPPVQASSNFNNVPLHAYNTPMQSYPSVAQAMPVRGASNVPSLCPQGPPGSSMPAHQRLSIPSHSNMANQSSCDQTLAVPPGVSGRKRAYDSMGAALFRCDPGYLSINPGYYGFPGPQGADPNHASQFGMTGGIPVDHGQSFNAYTPGNDGPAAQSTLRRGGSSFSSGSRKRGRYVPPTPHTVNVIKADNCTTSFDSLMVQGFVVGTLSKPTENCTICMESLREKSAYVQSGSSSVDVPDVVFFKNCQHHFHNGCLRAMYKAGMKNGSIQCPQCKAIYGTKRGNCPPGEMTYEFYDSSLPGHENYGTIFIKYHVAGGIQGEEHPNPGKPYSTRGFPRCCYLPNSPEGQKVLRLLIKAWKRRLTFTVGCSVTTGESDTVVWNEIHHKTEQHDKTGHGYPDPNYLVNVTDELAAHGVFDDEN